MKPRSQPPDEYDIRDEECNSCWHMLENYDGVLRFCLQVKGFSRTGEVLLRPYPCKKYIYARSTVTPWA